MIISRSSVALRVVFSPEPLNRVDACRLGRCRAWGSWSVWKEDSQHTCLQSPYRYLKATANTTHRVTASATVSP